MKPIPSKPDILADLHRLKILIEKKYTSEIDKMSTRYFHILNKMIVSQPKNLENLELDEVSSSILGENHNKDVYSPLRLESFLILRFLFTVLFFFAFKTHKRFLLISHKNAYFIA